MSKLKFKIGDKVKVNNPLFSNHEYKGLIGVIDKILLNDADEEARYCLKDCWRSFVHSELELTSTIEDKVTVFEPGDKVKVVSEITLANHETQHLGKIYTIKEIVANITPISGMRYIVEETNYIFSAYELRKVEEEMKKEFTLDDLRSGDVAKLKNGEVAIFIALNGVGSFVLKNSFLHIGHYNNDLTACNEDWDIVAIRRPETPYQCQYCAIDKGYGALVYERKEYEEMTVADIEKALGKKIKIVKEKK